MELYENEFISLPFKQQIDAVMFYGKELMQRNHLHFIVKLYTINNFFVEVWFISDTQHIENIELIDADDIIELYNINVDVENIFFKK